jgi:nicotinamidase/pyrazinamidase
MIFMDCRRHCSGFRIVPECCGFAFDYCVRFSALDTRKAGFDAVVIRDTCRAVDADRSVAAMEAAFAQRGVIAVDSTHLE